MNQQINQFLEEEKLEFGRLSEADLDAEYLRLTKLDIARAQAHLDELPEADRRGLTLNTYRHFGCGYIPDWTNTKNRAEFICGKRRDKNGNPKRLPPPSARIIVPTPRGDHFNAVATPSQRQKDRVALNDRLAAGKITGEEYRDQHDNGLHRHWKQHAGSKNELFCDPSALDADLIVIVEGELDVMSIWQDSEGKTAAVAIMGCDNWERTIPPALPKLTGKRILVLLDGDDAGVKAAKKLTNYLLDNGCIAVSRTLLSSFSEGEERRTARHKYGNNKMDFNSMLTGGGNLSLHISSIIRKAHVDFVVAEHEVEKRRGARQKQAEAKAAQADTDTSCAPAFNFTDSDNVNADEIKLILKDFVHAKDLTRNDWRAVGMILHNSGFSLDDWKNWSKIDDPRYDESVCDSEWAGFKSAEELGDKTPVTVRTLFMLAKENGYKPKCSFVGTKSKISTCPVDLRLPGNFSFSLTGITMDVPPKKDGDPPKQIRVANTPIVPVKIYCEPTKDSDEYEIAILSRRRWRKIIVPARTLFDAKALNSLCDAGAIITDYKALSRYFAEIIALNPDLKEIKAYNRTGWIDDDEWKEFAFPADNADFICRRAGYDYDRIFKPKGDPDAWKLKLVEVTEQGGTFARITIGIAAASILVRPLGLPNLQLHICGKRSIGKTPLLKFAVSIYGDPAPDGLTRTLAATLKNRLELATAFRDMPLLLDELESISKAEADNLPQSIYQYSLGVANQAQKRDGTARVVNKFSGVRLTSGERPILKQQDKAGAYKRVLTLRPDTLLEDSFASDLHNFTDRNHGLFATEWIRYVIRSNRSVIEGHFKSIYEKLKTLKPTADTTQLKTCAAAFAAYHHFCHCTHIRRFDTDEEAINAELDMDLKVAAMQLMSDDQVDDARRALSMLKDFFGGHSRYFYNDVAAVVPSPPPPEHYGKRFKTGEVAFYRTALTKILEKELGFASADKLFDEWADMGVLRCDIGRNTCATRINSSWVRAIRFKPDILLDSSEDEGHSLGGTYNEF